MCEVNVHVCSDTHIYLRVHTSSLCLTVLQVLSELEASILAITLSGLRIACLKPLPKAWFIGTSSYACVLRMQTHYLMDVAVAVVALAFNPSTWETKAGGSL